MNRVTILALSGLLCISLTTAHASDTDDHQDAPEFSPDQIQELLGGLGAAEYLTRHDAFLQLWQSGHLSLGAILDAKDSQRVQVAQSAEILEALIKLGVQPNDDLGVNEALELLANPTPMSIWQLCRRKHWQLAGELLKNNPDLVRKFTEPQGAIQIPRIAYAAYRQEELDLAWPIMVQLLDLRTTSWLATQNDLPLPVATTPAEQAVVDYFSGDVDTALSSTIPLREKIPWIARSGRWNQLATPEVLQEMQSGVEPLIGQAIDAVLQDLAGNTRAASQAWDALYAGLLNIETGQKVDRIQGGVELLRRSAADLELATFTLLASGQPEAIAEYLMEVNKSHGLIYQLSRFQFAEAFSSLGLQPDLSNFDTWLETRRQEMTDENTQSTQQLFAENSRLCADIFGLGYPSQSEKMLDMLVDTIHAKVDPLRRSMRTTLQTRMWGTLCLALHREEAHQMILSRVKENYTELSPGAQSIVLRMLYPDIGGCASVLLRLSPGQSPSEVANQIPKANDSNWDSLEHLWLLDSSFFGDDGEATITSWLQRTADEMGSGPVGEDALQELVQVAMDLGMVDSALQLATSSSTGPGSHMATAASILSGKARWEQAALYLSALRSSGSLAYVPQEIETLLLAGKFEQAQVLERFRWLAPLSMGIEQELGPAYSKIAGTLEDAEQYQAAAQYAQAGILLAAPYAPSGFSYSQVLARCLTELDQHIASADARRACMVELLHPGSAVRNLLVSMPSRYEYTHHIGFSLHQERLSRAIGLVEKGDFSAAMHEARIGSDMVPMDVEMVVACVPRLRKAGRDQDADELFERFDNTLSRHLDAWPNDSTTLNNLAWMYANCDTRLDRALEMATQATKLFPRSAVYLDTLAEVHYRRGDVEAATRAMQTCTKLDPRGSHYRENLVRFRTGQP